MPTDCVVVIPTYNEAENIAALIGRILAEPRFRVLVVDDQSQDGTGHIVEGISRACERVRLLARRKKEGLGMGLSIARTIIESHKGRLWADNNPEGGAAFHIALPVSIA